MVATSAGPATAAPLVCYTIQHGETAALISWRLTGSAQQTVPAVVSDRRRAVEGRAEVALPLDSCGVAGVHSFARMAVDADSATSLRSRDSASALQGRPADLRPERRCRRLVGVAVLVVVLLALDGWRYMRWRQAIVSTMQQFGETVRVGVRAPVEDAGLRRASGRIADCGSSPAGNGWRFSSRPPAGGDTRTSQTIEAM